MIYIYIERERDGYIDIDIGTTLDLSFYTLLFDISVHQKLRNKYK